LKFERRKNSSNRAGNWNAFTFAATKLNVVLLIYNFLIRLYVLGIRLASLWNAKAKQWINGREKLFEKLEKKINNSDKLVWFHCASAGEFEQGKPVIEVLKKAYPSYRVLVSFFSPSGFTAARKYQHADIITYLPADTRKNARRFVELIKPELVVFVKYEYWYHHLSAVAFRHIPLLMVSAIFREDQLFFRPYGSFYKRLLFLFRQIFVQDSKSLELLKTNGIHHCSLSGDTRFDRVNEIAGRFSEVPLLKEFVGESKTIVAGSSWEQDEEILAAYVRSRDVKIVIAPHEIKEDHILRIQKLFPDCIRYSQVQALFTSKHVDGTSIWSSINEQQEKDIEQRVVGAKTMIIDGMGLLSKLYHYATVTYVGGGFKSGIHNTLEAVVYGKPVLFGPKYQKFKEARDLIEKGAAFSVTNSEDLTIKIDRFLNDPSVLLNTSEAARKYVVENTGATGKIIQYIQENRLLTN
jgi:3-deoxy-D-manno-octulosonic-acid transferase